MARSMFILFFARAATALVVQRSVAVDGAPAAWHDVTLAVSNSLPPLPHAIVTVASSTERVRLAVLDPAMLEVGPVSVVAPNRQSSIAFGVRDGALLLPENARLLLLPVDDSESGEAEGQRCLVPGDLQVTVEAAEALLTSPGGPSGATAIAQAALRTALAVQGSDSAAVAALETADEPTAAGRVYESFLGQEHRPEALMAAARRAAHHIGHLLREEAAAKAAYLRNNDAAARTTQRLSPHPLTLVLDNVRSAYNVGSLFRTADTARCAEIVTCGYTPHPPHPKLAKTAFGALDSVATTHEESTLHAVRALQKRGVKVYAMETTDSAVNYAAAAFPRGEAGIALVLGNEQIGVDTNVLAAVDGTVEIPTFGLKNSLNVASAGAIVVYEVLRQWGELEGEKREACTIRGE